MLDISNPDFPGIYSWQGAFIGPRPNTKTHPHLKLDETMVSVPKVYPGDMVFWHCVRISEPLQDTGMTDHPVRTGRDPCCRKAAHWQGGLDGHVHPRYAVHAHQRGVRAKAEGELPQGHRAARLPDEQGRDQPCWGGEGG